MVALERSGLCYIIIVKYVLDFGLTLVQSISCPRLHALRIDVGKEWICKR